MQPQVADGTARVATRHDRVVGEERIEDGGRADAPSGCMFELRERHCLDAGDAAVVDPRRRDAHHTGVGERCDELASALGAAVTFGDVEAVAVQVASHAHTVTRLKCLLQRVRLR